MGSSVRFAPKRTHETDAQIERLKPPSILMLCPPMYISGRGFFFPDLQLINRSCLGLGAWSMLAWLDNAWVVGIVGGIVSGIIVFLITNWLFSGQGKRELGRRIALANREVVLAVRQGIPENTVPTPEVLDALTKATARKHALRAEELYGAAEVAQDLIKEVMDSSFISAATKEEYCKRLAELDKPEKPLSEAEIEAQATSAQRWSSARSGIAGLLSAGFATTAALMTALLGFFTARTENSDVFANPGTTAALLIPIVATVLGAVVAMAAVTLMRLRRERELTENLVRLTAEENQQRKPRRTPRKESTAPTE